jgi:hypothetical protein
MAKQIVSGEVEAVNAKGLKIDGSWLNYSKFYKGTTPGRGDEVELVVDGNWINDISVKNGGAVALPGSAKSGAPRDRASGRYLDTDLRIARQVALKAAVDRANASGEDDDDKVIALAAKFEAFLNKPLAAAAAAQDDEDDIEF